uniref:C3H1-type domain-containing protein n=1 Tax=Gorilla gorilla gorilla TaxID=9595 RepID=A0A2I2ZRQ9_GORGO
MAAPEKVTFPEKPSHKKYRAALKKEKRKKRQQELAPLRDSGLSQKEEDTFIEKQQLEKLWGRERQRLHEEWLLREQKAQEEFRIKKEKEEVARKRQEQERMLKEQWEEQQRKERGEEEQKRQKKQKPEAVQKMLDQAENELENVMEKDGVNCPFYSKTGACRFGDRCSHNFPTSSPTLLIKSMFTVFGMEQCRRDDYDSEASLEYSEEETYQQFLDFYEDVLPEFKNVGRDWGVIQFKGSCNLEPHLREECQAALSLFNGRWYVCRTTRKTLQLSSGVEKSSMDLCLSPDLTGSSFGKSSKRRDRMGHHDEYYRLRGRRNLVQTIPTKEMGNLKGKGRNLTSTCQRARRGTIHQVEEEIVTAAGAGAA